MVGTMNMVSRRSRSMSSSRPTGSKRGISTMVRGDPARAHREGVGRGVVERARHGAADAGRDAEHVAAQALELPPICSGVGAGRRTPLGLPVVPEV